ncbi:hypothetical protein RND71_032323 [Anisodus tanguticus]|uniref:Uncharacterized protein n=1 Tax=Anisodus tanguticus TaxID=243964 RepID=A0AAE1UYA7_9SOLA|nr:hypothetical protein RND71_032323 [Anisodus tanguticus]
MRRFLRSCNGSSTIQQRRVRGFLRSCNEVEKMVFIMSINELDSTTQHLSTKRTLEEWNEVAQSLSSLWHVDHTFTKWNLGNVSIDACPFYKDVYKFSSKENGLVGHCWATAESPLLPVQSTAEIIELRRILTPNFISIEEASSHSELEDGSYCLRGSDRCSSSMIDLFKLSTFNIKFGQVSFLFLRNVRQMRNDNYLKSLPLNINVRDLMF